MTSWLMWDSATPDVLPAGPCPVAVYSNGMYRWTAAQLARHTGPKVTIDVLGTMPSCMVLDVESGAATPADAARWIRERNAIDPGTATIYCNRGTLPEVQAACRGLSYWVWLATLDGTVCYSSLPGSGTGGTLAAVQGWGASALGFNADLSVILSAEWYKVIGGR